MLKGLCIYNDIESLLNEFYQAADSRNKIGIVSQLVLTISEFITTLHIQLHKIDSCNYKVLIEKRLVVLVYYLVKDSYCLSELKPSEYYYLLTNTIKRSYTRYSWNFLVTEKLLRLDKFRQLTIPEKACNISKPNRLAWQGIKQLDLFVYDLAKTFRGFKAQKQLYFLFDNIRTDFKIELSSNHLLPFLTLFYKLHESGVIKVCGNRGLFIFLKQHLVPPQKDVYPKRDFRKLKHEGEQNEKTRTNNFCIIKPLLDKYCCNA